MSQDIQNSPITEELDYNDLVRVRREKLKDLVSNGQDPFLQVKFDRTSNAQQIISDFEAMEGSHVAIAGRIMSKLIWERPHLPTLRQNRVDSALCKNRRGRRSKLLILKRWYTGITVLKVRYFNETWRDSIKLSICFIVKALLPIPEKFTV
jgi:lysyl-tRNA synthetase class 2